MKEILQGKVKTVYDTEDAENVLIEFHDKVTAGNGRKVDFPEGKGEVCCQISSILFEKIAKVGVKTHYLSVDANKMCCKRVDIVPIEVVCRNLAAGSIVRETPFEEGISFHPPLVEFYLKDDSKNDPLLTLDRVRLMKYNPYDYIGITQLINVTLKSIFDEMDMDLVDFKLEFGHTSSGDLVVADELSPDSMRLWKKGTKESFDKDLFRKEKGDIVRAYKYILQQLKEFS